MGNDGGTIAKRKDLISSNVEQAPQTGENNESTLLATCGISSLPLYAKNSPPVVGDSKGHLYLKEKLLEYLLSQKVKVKDKTVKSDDKKEDSSNPKIRHIRSLKDVSPVKITWGVEDGTQVIECPVTQERKHHNTSYAYLRPCGCLLSYKILQELGKHVKVGKEPVASTCPNCSVEFYYDYDIVILNPLNLESIIDFNSKNLKYIEEVLHLTHSKSKRKSEKHLESTKKRKLA